MADKQQDDPPTVFDTWRTMQQETLRSFMPGALPAALDGAAADLPDSADLQHWTLVAAKLQKMWLDYSTEQVGDQMAKGEPALRRMFDPAQWTRMVESWYRQMPLGDPKVQNQLWEEGLQLWQAVLGQFGIGPAAREDGGKSDGPDLPRKDRRFADPRWRQQPAFALIHQTYLMLAEQIGRMADKAPGLDKQQRAQLKFTTQAILDALSPANFPLTNPVVLERTLATKGDNLVKGTEHLLADLRKGQLTHTDPEAFELGRNIAVTPGKVVYQTALFQLIQYTPTTPDVLAVPLVIFPPWINRFYILDLNPAKSFIRWAVEQGITVFVVSWKSADASMAETTWDDYVRSQIEAIDHVRERLDVPAVHTIGYCVAGTTLAATLAVLARRGEADKVASATYFTAQVDFEQAGDLRLLVEDAQLSLMEQLTTDGYLDGRYMAATFNLLRGPDLIWNYVVNNYLMGEDYPAFDLLHWNGDTTNLPFKWQKAYLEDLYRDNRLVQPDSLSVDGTPIDLSLIATPTYIQAGREDHIAPAASVWELTRYLKGPWKFVLAGSGHIAGVVNPPEAGKYQYWTNPEKANSLDGFIAGASETKGSWWPNWIDWLKERDSRTVKASGKRVPGGKGDTVIEDAPGSYVKTR
ncbi:PHA/PHB synthase family protein [Novosphingobium tardum]|uniref:PHA/PHB synthase family protein n=1 Tax=Novosphingobium tardum TaxID=1538021 RepID=A0ABV8RLM2_9SPHN